MPRRLSLLRFSQISFECVCRCSSFGFHAASSKIFGVIREASINNIVFYILIHVGYEGTVGDGNKIAGGIMLVWKSGGVIAIAAAAFVRLS